MVNQLNYRIALLKKGLSQNALALKLGLNPAVLCSKVKGYYKAEPELITQISKALDIPEKDLVNKESAA
jgi:ribosome-binding protein aMBF1 (putative translation factor)